MSGRIGRVVDLPVPLDAGIPGGQVLPLRLTGADGAPCRAVAVELSA